MLLDPKTGQIYTPNTNQYAAMGETAQMPLTDEGKSGRIEERSNGGNPYHDHKNGQFASSNGFLSPEERRSLLETKLKSGEISAVINPEKQARHRKDDPSYKVGRSYVTATDEQLQEFANECAKADGDDVHVSNHGKQIKVTAAAPFTIGVDVDRTTKKEEVTNRATTHFSKSGTRVVPSKPKGDEEND